MGFELTISAGERLQNCALDRAATVTGYSVITEYSYYLMTNEEDSRCLDAKSDTVY